MNDDQSNSVTETTEEQKQEKHLAVLKDRARTMGIVFSNNIGLDALRQKIKDKTEGTKTETVATDAVVEEINPLVGKKQKKKSLRSEVIAEQTKLVRIRVQCLDPKKKDYPGEIFTVANGIMGTIRKFVPFGEQTDDGYHVPFCIYNMMKKRKFLNITTRKVNGSDHKVGVQYGWVREFAIEVLPQLTADELRKLATAQVSAGTGSVG